MSDVAVVVAGGGTTPQVVPRSAREADFVVAADSGLDLARRLGLVVDAVVGDLDSVSVDALAEARAGGVAVLEAPTDKDETDLELALVHARGAEVGRVVVLGGAAGRLDHLLANLAVLSGPLTDGLDVEAWLGTTRVWVVRDEVAIRGARGAALSLLAWHGDAEGVSTTGLRWPLHGAVLPAGSAWGTSNEVVDDEASVTVGAGVVSAVIDGFAWDEEVR